LSGDQLVARQVGTPDTHQYTESSITLRIVPRLRRLGLIAQPGRHNLNPSSIHVRFVVDKMTRGQVLLRVLGHPPVTIIPPVRHIHSRTTNTI